METSRIDPSKAGWYRRCATLLHRRRHTFGHLLTRRLYAFAIRLDDTRFQPAYYKPEVSRHQQNQPEHQRSVLEARAVGFRKRVEQYAGERARDSSLAAEYTTSIHAVYSTADQSIVIL